IFQSVTRKIWCVPESSNSDDDVVGGGRVFRVAGVDVDMDGEKAEADAAREAPRVFTMDGGFHAMRGLEGRQVVGHVEGGPLVLGPKVGGGGGEGPAVGFADVQAGGPGPGLEKRTFEALVGKAEAEVDGQPLA